jgi:N-acetylglucosamine-6-phosphate deacetylase
LGQIAFTNAELLDPELQEPLVGTLLVEDGRIAGRLDPSQTLPPGAKPIDLFGTKLAPGFIDLHHHGELVFAELDEIDEALVRTSASLVRHGCTAFLVTTLAWRSERLELFMTRVINSMTHRRPWGAQPVGLHLEGPWINPAAAGAQPTMGIRPASITEAREIVARSEGALQLVTLAPEVEGAAGLVELLVREGAAVALGHTLADSQSIDAAVERGMTHVTHLYNAMGPFHQRRPGVAGHVLADDRLTCDLICDGAHLHPSVVKVAARALAERLLLITDQVALPSQVTAEARGLRSFGSGEVVDDGTALRLADGRLAGSRLNLDRAVANLRAFAQVSLLEAVQACTVRPARVLGIEHERGTFRPRSRADLVVLSDEGEVLETWVEGRRVYEAAARR